ncbi:MAG: hypothetical protein ACFE8U_08380 [Candidatus Hermodarchaeota archaeon]
MLKKSPDSLKTCLDELNLKVLVHFEKNEGVIGKVGDEVLTKALIKSNLLVVLQSEMPPIPIRLISDNIHEIYEMVLYNNRGLVAKEGRANSYLVALRLDSNNVIAAIGDDLDPGMVLFELMQFNQK